MVTIVEVPPPASADDRNVWAARAQTRLWNAESVALLGYADLTDTEEAPGCAGRCLRPIG